MENKRVIVVANRLPFTTERIGEDSWSLQPSSGGLVSALTGLDNVLWIGCTDVCVDDEVGQRSLAKILKKKKIIPVFLDAEMIREYYDGYCNRFLWSQLHYFDLPQEMTVKKADCIDLQFKFYKKVNKLVFETVKRHCKEGDVIWCQDYHFMLLPKRLRNLNMKIKIGWFLHTPFPCSDVFSKLPSRSKLLRGVLGADLIGFHTSKYKRNFIDACAEILGFDSTSKGVRDDQGRFTRVIDSPIEIDPSKFLRSSATEVFQMHYDGLWECMGNRKVIIGIDRLDPIKGVVQKLLAYEKFLEENPLWHNKVVFFQLIIPSRTNVREYKKLKAKIERIKGRIDLTYQKIATWNPILVRFNGLVFDEMCALLTRADVGLVTSFRDGLNLVSYEFLACQAVKTKPEKKGVLILSEFAGASQTLQGGALNVNPFSIGDIVSKIKKALTLSSRKRREMFRLGYAQVATQTTKKWANGFLRKLRRKNKKRMGTELESEKRKRIC